MEGYHLPLSPSKRVQELQNLRVPGSPDMKHARNRLDNLLIGIRKGESQQTFREDSAILSEIEELDEHKKGPGRPRKPRPDNKVVFELRGKTFGMQDTDRDEPIYCMCRRWMYGKDDEKIEAGSPPPALPDNISLDLMATKPIYAMPKPDTSVPELPLVPEGIADRPQEPEYAGKDVKELPLMMAQHMKHWKNVRRRITEHSEARKRRYKRSLDLLRTVYNIAQQTQT
ncbi:unnamed protein product [Bursaphelenchus xylophilus]|uniref:(pine wood nematode) hypothetical protein n=1 Tax=Bursaphelenchus xylophilus TaxID=6326 RepID=A0A1I7S9T6_BURXY|nr:unnamed protein product [Bursaphelenchus xylophilus]CAG9129226.1 unnamed protein product [Bursaphelenchus xylophilus]